MSDMNVKSSEVAGQWPVCHLLTLWSVSAATEYPALTADTRSQAQFCNDIATLEPVYNPLATVINANATGISANPLTTVASFGQSYGKHLFLLASEAPANKFAVSGAAHANLMQSLS